LPEDRTLALGLWLLLVSLPLGLTLEALHALKVQVYLGSALRRELWTLAHAHGNLLGILCLALSSVAVRAWPEVVLRRAVLRSLGIGAVLLPLGFFAGGVLNYEGDPSYGIVLVPVGAAFLLFGLLRGVWGQSKTGAQV
jgi:hypothetical protein